MSDAKEPPFTTATDKVKPNFRKRRLLQALSAWYALFWCIAAISPVDRQDWLLENMLVFVFVGLLVCTFRKFPLSDTSYVLITVFMTVHAVGAHYTYSKVPLGFWFQETFDLSRNHYDRAIHFAFGLLMAYPIREVFLRVANTRGFWAYYLPMDVTLAFSALFELGEAAVAFFVSPDLGNAYLGTQGDEWDAQKDMACALVGAMICMAAVAYLHEVYRKNKRVKSPVKLA